MSHPPKVISSRPPVTTPGAEPLATTLGHALIGALDALAALHRDRPGPWLDEIEQSLLREAERSGADEDSIGILGALVLRVRRRLDAETGAS